MALDVLLRKKLWGRAHNLCAYPKCDQALIQDLVDNGSEPIGDGGILLGEEAHIRSGKKGGPRHDPLFPEFEIDSYQNVILLCPTHHTLVDKNHGSSFTTERLLEMKRDHEEKSISSESRSEWLQRETIEKLAKSIDFWDDTLDIDDWQNVTYGLNQLIPAIDMHHRDGIAATAQWLLAKDWPTNYPKIVQAFQTNKEAAMNLLAFMVSHFEDNEDHSGIRLERAYKRIDWNPSLYAKLLKEFRLNSAVSWWLVADLTKSINLVIAAVREEIDPLYRFDSGMILSRDGSTLIHSITRPQYASVEIMDVPKRPTLQQVRDAIRQAALDAGRDADDFPVLSVEILPSSGDSNLQRGTDD